MRHVRITIEIAAWTTLDDDTLESRLESLVDPAELEAQALEDDECTEFENTVFRFSELEP